MSDPYMTTAPRVKIRNPATLYHALAHHAKLLEPMVGVLAVGLSLDLYPRGWELVQHGTGAGSYSIRKGDLQYHFRATGQLGKAFSTITVKDRYQLGNIVTILTTRLDAVRFIAARVKES